MNTATSSAAAPIGSARAACATLEAVLAQIHAQGGDLAGTPCVPRFEGTATSPLVLYAIGSAVGSWWCWLKCYRSHATWHRGKCFAESFFGGPALDAAVVAMREIDPRVSAMPLGRETLRRTRPPADPLAAAAAHRRWFGRKGSP